MTAFGFAVVLGLMTVFTGSSQASPVPVPQFTGAGPGDIRYFMGFSMDNIKYGPGTVDSGAAGAGPGPWNLISSGENGGPSLPVNVTLQNVGDRTAELLVNNILQLSIAGGQSASVPVIVANNQPLAIRFVGGGTRGKVIWAGR